ncbi:hypothetical protein [Chlamydiifrater volucris]
MTASDEALKFQCLRQVIRHIVKNDAQFWNYGVGKGGEFLRAKGSILLFC